MNPTPTQNLIWLVENLGFLAVGWQLIRLRQIGRWPSIFTYCIIYAIGSAVLYACMGVYATYFWIFWIREAILASVRVWILADMVRSIPSGRYIPTAFKTVSGSGGVVVFFVACAVTSHGAKPECALDWVLLINRCALVGWAGSLIVILGTIALSGFGFYRHAVQIGSGYLVMILSSMVTGAVYGSKLSMNVRIKTNEVAGLLSIAILAYWFRSFSLPDGITSLAASHENSVMAAFRSTQPGTTIHSPLEKDGSQ